MEIVLGQTRFVSDLHVIANGLSRLGSRSAQYPTAGAGTGTEPEGVMQLGTKQEISVQISIGGTVSRDGQFC